MHLVFLSEFPRLLYRLFSSCEVWSVLFGNHGDRFSCDEAYMQILISEIASVKTIFRVC